MHPASCSMSSRHTIAFQVSISRVDSYGRDSLTIPVPGLRNPSSFILELESCSFLLRQHAFLLHPLSASREKSSRKRTGKAAVTVVVPDAEADELELSSTPTLNSGSPVFAGATPETTTGAVSGHIKIEATEKQDKWARVREEVREIVVHFLETRGVSGVLSEIAVKKAPTFIAHLLSLLESCYPARYVSGKELTGIEIRSIILPYLDNLGRIHKKDVDNIISKFPDVSGAPDLASFVPQPTSKILSGYPLLLEHLVDGKLPPSLSYCFSIGLNAAQVEATVKKFPPIVGYSFEGKMENVVNFILTLDVSYALIPKIVLKRPQLFGCDVEHNLRPSVHFLETLGVDHNRWGRILVTFPHMLTYSSSKTALVFNFLIEVGVSSAGAGKILSRFPHAVGYSVEFKMRPMVAYFQSLGIEDFSRILIRSPQTLGLSLEGNIKPTIHFLLSLGFSREELISLLYRFPQVLGLNVEHNLQAKWQFFLKMDRCTTELVDFPQYFGYSLENRIQPRYEIIVKKQLSWSLNRMLTSSDEMFLKLTDSRDDVPARSVCLTL